MTDFGLCPRCGTKFRPKYFQEEEIEYSQGCQYKTGRTRLTVDYLYCEDCGKKEYVDVTFDKEWR